MLEALRRGASGIFAKLLLGLLVVSFAVWGVADVFRSYGTGAIAKVGSREVTEDEYKRALGQRLQLIQQQRGMNLTPEQARAFGLTNEVLMGMLREHLIDAHTHQLGLGLSDKGVADQIQLDANLKSFDGKFNRAQFESYLRAMGMSEAQYVAARRGNELRQQLTDALQAGIVPSPVLIEMLHKHQEEQRVVAYFTLTPDKMAKPAEPTPAKLKELFDQTRKQHVWAEMRAARVLLVTIDELKKKHTIPEETVKAEYEATKEATSTPEKRRVLQVSFPTKAAAEAALPKLTAAKSFEDGAVALGFKAAQGTTPAEFDLGVLTAKEMIDPKLAAAAFALPKDTTSGIVEGALTVAVMRVTEIQPGKVPTFEEMKGPIADRLAADKARPELGKLHDSIDDERATRQPMKAIAEKIGAGAVYFDVASTDKAGKGADGKPALPIAEAQIITRAIFEGAVGIEREAIDLGQVGYAWVDVVSVTPAKLKTLEEVSEQLKTVHIESEIRKSLQDKARIIVERVHKGEAFEKLAIEHGLTPVLTKPFKRTDPVEGLSPGAIQQAFALAKGAAGSAPAMDIRSRTVLSLIDTLPASAPTIPQAAAIREKLLRGLQGDMIEAYLLGLQERVGVTINQAAFNRAIGVDPTQQR